MPLLTPERWGCHRFRPHNPVSASASVLPSSTGCRPGCFCHSGNSRLSFHRQSIPSPRDEYISCRPRVSQSLAQHVAQSLAQHAPKASASWRLGADSLYATQQVGAAVLGWPDLGGRGLTDPQHATTKTEFYDPTVGTWSQGPEPPVPLDHATTASYQDTVWVIGGFEPQGGEVIRARLRPGAALSQALTAWVEAPALHHARGAGAAAVAGNKIVLVAGGPRHRPHSRAGGLPDPGSDGTSWHDAAAIPVPGDHLAAASDGKYLYAVGGRRLEVTANTAAVQRFDPNADRWIELQAVPGKVSDCGAAIVGGQRRRRRQSIGTVFSTVRPMTWPARPGPPCRASPNPGTGWPSQRSATPGTPSTRIPARTERLHPHHANPHLSQLITST